MPRAQNPQPVHPIRVFLHALELLVKSKEDDDDEDGADDGPDHVEKGQRLGTSGIVFVIQAQPLVQRPHFAPARKESVVSGPTSALGVAQWRSTVMNRDLSTGPLARPFARTAHCSLAPDCSHPPLHSLVRLLAHFAYSLAHGKENF